MASESGAAQQYLRVGMRPSYAMPTSISQRFSGAETDDFRESPIPERARQGLGFNPCFSFGDAGTFLARFLIISNACAPHSSPTKTGRTGLESLNASIFIFGCDGTHGLIDYLLQTIIFRSEEHTSELQSRLHLVCRLLLEKKKKRY